MSLLSDRGIIAQCEEIRDGHIRAVNCLALKTPSMTIPPQRREMIKESQFDGQK